MLATDDERREVARRLRMSRSEWSGMGWKLWLGTKFGAVVLSDGSRDELEDAARLLADLIEPSDGRRTDEWRDFATDPPSDKKPVLCKSANGRLYVGNPCFFANDTFTGKVWVPRGDRYRKPMKWMEIDDD